MFWVNTRLFGSYPTTTSGPTGGPRNGPMATSSSQRYGSELYHDIVKSHSDAINYAGQESIFDSNPKLDQNYLGSENVPITFFNQKNISNYHLEWLQNNLETSNTSDQNYFADVFFFMFY